MGRDKSDRVSSATYLDIHTTVRQCEIDYDCMVDVHVTASPLSRQLFCQADAVAYNLRGVRREFHTEVVVSSSFTSLSSGIYRAVTRLYHDIGLWRQRTDPLD